MTTSDARTEYRRLRALSTLAPAAFDAKAGRVAREFADGEQVQPAHWVKAASEVLYERGEWQA